MKFKKITVSCPSEASESIAYFLHEEGSLGEVFDDYNDVKRALDEKRWDYADVSLFEPREGCSVSGFFDMEADTEKVIEKVVSVGKSISAELSVSIESIDSAEWENEWKKYYKPFNIDRIVIIPEWIDYKQTQGDIPVYLDPGLAFGTGSHETTSMCVDFLQRIDVKNKRVIDFGCGSGILGICAKALGAGEVLFVDTDEQAITATKNNCKLNGISSPEVLLQDVRSIDRPADIVVANITADVLIAVRPIISSILKKGGYAIISGIISQAAEEVKKEYDKDFSLVYSDKKNEWNAYLYKL